MEEPPSKGYKRAWIVRSESGWGVAGAFTGEIAALDSSCGPPGFSAWARRLRALAYAPAHSAVVRVELEVASVSSDGELLRGLRQRVEAIDLTPVCLVCHRPVQSAAESGLGLFDAAVIDFPHDVELLSVGCAAHRPAVRMEATALSRELGARLGMLGAAWGRWASVRLGATRRHVPGRCWCAHLDAVDALSRWYDVVGVWLREEGTGLECIVCGAGWVQEYQRGRPPRFCRTRAGDPLRAHATGCEIPRTDVRDRLPRTP